MNSNAIRHAFETKLEEILARKNAVSICKTREKHGDAAASKQELILTYTSAINQGIKSTNNTMIADMNITAEEEKSDILIKSSRAIIRDQMISRQSEQSIKLLNREDRLSDASLFVRRLGFAFLDTMNDISDETYAFTVVNKTVKSIRQQQNLFKGD
jgi:hypothetical protein